MWSRSAAAAGLVLGLSALGSGQNTSTYSRAIPPDPAALARLNLRTEWTLNLPVAGGRDTVDLIQPMDDQLFVQTRTGRLIAVDARNGRVQWAVNMGNGGYTNVFPVAANAKFVFATHVTQVFAFHRDTGIIEFSQSLGTTPVAGVSADASGLYVLLGTQPGAAGAHRIMALDLPHPITVTDPTKARATKAGEAVREGPNAIDQLTNKYPAPSVHRPSGGDTFERSGATFDRPQAAAGGGSRSPSLAAVPRVTPPYSLEGQPNSPSLQTVPSLRQPYRLTDESGRMLHRTPSLSTIPPSVAAALALSDLRPKGARAKERWEYGLTSGALFSPVLTPSRVWVVTDVKSVVALSKENRNVEVDGRLWEQLAAPPGQAGTIAYVPLADGSLLAADLESGNRVSGLNLTWRTNVGGILNRTPVVTHDSVYASGDNSGVVRVDRATGAVAWRSDKAADRVLAVNQDFAYIRERQGKLLVFDAKRATDPATGRAAPLTGLDLPEFNIPVVNRVTDRVFLAADNGLIVCLRDASRKYEAPVRMAPPVVVDATPRALAAPAGMPPDTMPKDGMPPAPPAPPAPPKP